MSDLSSPPPPRVLKPTLSRQFSEENPNECPICFETTGGEILPLVHEKVTEHTQTHRACASCRALLKERNEPCPWCRDGVVYRPGCESQKAAESLAQRIEDHPEPEEPIQLPPGIKQCPACGILVQRISGSAEMMCGCAARPAGGTLLKALRGGGCGHEWNWDSLQPINYGRPGQPAHPRQTRFGRCDPVDVPLCAHLIRADEECEICGPAWAQHAPAPRPGRCCVVM